MKTLTSTTRTTKNATTSIAQEIANKSAPKEVAVQAVAQVSAPKWNAYIMTNTAPGTQLRAYFIATLQLAGAVTKAGSPSVKGGSAAWLRANSAPLKVALKHHTSKGNLEVSGDKVTINATGKLPADFGSFLADATKSALVEAYKVMMQTGEVNEAIQGVKGATPSIMKPKA